MVQVVGLPAGSGCWKRACATRCQLMNRGTLSAFRREYRCAKDLVGFRWQGEQCIHQPCNQDQVHVEQVYRAISYKCYTWECIWSRALCKAAQSMLGSRSVGKLCWVVSADADDPHVTHRSLQSTDHVKRIGNQGTSQGASAAFWSTNARGFVPVLLVSTFSGMGSDLR